MDFLEEIFEEDECSPVEHPSIKEEGVYLGRGLASEPKVDTLPKSRCCQMNSCAKMHTYDWTSLFPDTANLSDFPLVEIRFKNTRKEFFRIEENLADFSCGDIVTVESTSGYDMGVISLRGELAKIQWGKKKCNQEVDSLKKVLRKSPASDIEKWNESIKREKETQRRARIIAAELGLSMKIINVEFQADISKAIFYYTADDRVDFRLLIRRYAEEFKIRIEMKQIGARQEAGNLGGLGGCGREICCSSFLRHFQSVGTQAARIQDISLNPQKLAGQCGKLKCCLNYEVDVYTDALKKFPTNPQVLDTEKGKAKWIKNDVLKGSLFYVYEENTHRPYEISLEKWAERVKCNKEGKKCAPLEGDYSAPLQTTPVLEFENAVGQDDLTRFDSAKQSNHKNKKRNYSKNYKKEKNHDKEIDNSRNS